MVSAPGFERLKGGGVGVEGAVVVHGDHRHVRAARGYYGPRRIVGVHDRHCRDAPGHCCSGEAVVSARGADVTVIPMDDNRPLNSYDAALNTLRAGG